MFHGKIRTLQKEDVPAVEAIYDLYWSDDFRENLSKKLRGFLENDPAIVDQKFTYYVAEENAEVVGVAGFRKAPDHMKDFARTDDPVELYILAVKHKRKGIGKA